MKKCINFIAYNRPNYFSEVLNSWKNVDKINEYDLYFFLDYSDKTQEIKNLIRKFIKEKVNPSKQKVQIKISNPKQGVNAAMYNALSYSFDNLKYDFVVMAEDDIVVAKDSLKLLEYMHNKTKNISSVIFYNLFSRSFSNDDVQLSTKLFKNNLFVPWGWGTTKINWNNFIKSFWDHTYQNGWDHNLSIKMKKDKKMFSITPCISRSKNIGIFGVNYKSNHYCDHRHQDIKINENYNYGCDDLIIAFDNIN